jgi:hypothetical protein
MAIESNRPKSVPGLYARTNPHHAALPADVPRWHRPFMFARVTVNRT